MSERIVVGMSGGVDSSVAAYLTRQQGYECIGMTMKLYDNDQIGLDQGLAMTVADYRAAVASGSVRL